MFTGDSYSNNGSKDGIFAKLYGVTPFFLTFVTEDTRFSDKRGRLFDFFLFQHNTSLNESVTDNSFTISKQTHNIKDLEVGIKKKINTNEYFLYANRTGIIFINKIDAGKCVEVMKPFSIKENSIDKYETVSSAYSMFFLNGNEDKLQNLEAGTLFYDTNTHSLKYNIWGSMNPQTNIDWFYFERSNYRKFITKKTTFPLGSTYENFICEFSLINRFEKEYIDKLKISVNGYWSGNVYIDHVKASFQSYTDDKYFKIFIKNHNVYITFNTNVYISYNRYIEETDVDLTDVIEVNVITNLVSSDSLPILYNTKGKSFYCTNLNKPLWFNGSQYLDALGNIAKITKGNTSQRPSLNKENEGFEYYDTSLKKKILWNGTAWVNLDGSSLDIKKSGATNERPSNVEIGFIYKDTTLNKLILWEGTKWVNLDGTEL